MQTVLVTGGAGFIGRHVCRSLIMSGFKPLIFDDFSNASLERAQGLGTVVRGDIRNREAVAAAMEGVDHVVHLAALVSVPVSLDKPLETFDINVRGTEVVLAACREANGGAGLPGRFVFASSASVYGAVANEVFREEDAAGQVHLSPYASSKYINEIQAGAYRSCYGVKATGVRFFNVYGPGQDPRSPYSGVLTRVMETIENKGEFTINGDGSITRDYVAVEDVASAVVGLLRLPISVEVDPVMNIGTGVKTDLKGLIEKVNSVLPQPLPVRYGPARPGDQQHSCADISRLRAVLPDWQPTPLDKGLESFLNSAL